MVRSSRPDGIDGQQSLGDLVASALKDAPDHPAATHNCGRAIRSQAWPGFGGQEGSETSGVSPNNNPRRERPAS